jgi:hypothetical protein
VANSIHSYTHDMMILFTRTYLLIQIRAFVKIICIHSIRTFYEYTVQSGILNGPLYRTSYQTSFLSGEVKVLGSEG